MLLVFIFWWTCPEEYPIPWFLFSILPDPSYGLKKKYDSALIQTYQKTVYKIDMIAALNSNGYFLLACMLTFPYAFNGEVWGSAGGLLSNWLRGKPTIYGNFER